MGQQLAKIVLAWSGGATTHGRYLLLLNSLCGNDGNGLITLSAPRQAEPQCSPGGIRGWDQICCLACRPEVQQAKRRQMLSHAMQGLQICIQHARAKRGASLLLRPVIRPEPRDAGTTHALLQVVQAHFMCPAPTTPRRPASMFKSADALLCSLMRDIDRQV